MKARLALAVAALQVVVLAFMAGQREWISRTGMPITLRTAPIDPSDPMRGAYVHLDYEISVIPAALCRGAVAQWAETIDYRERERLRDRVVYAALKVNVYGLADVTSLSNSQPASGPFLRGRVQNVDENGVHVRYGIEALFMNKEAAKRMEDDARNAKAGTPINTHVAVGASGISVLKDYAWEPLGLTIAFDRPLPETREPQQRWQPRPLTGLTVTLHNYSDRELAVVDLPDAKSFRLVTNTRFASAHYAWAGEKHSEQPAAPVAQNIIVLKPGATHSAHLDLTQPQWWIIDMRKPDSAPIPLQKVENGWAASFRIEYAPPSAEACRALPHADLIRHAPLRSRAFSANQSVD